MGWLFQTMRVTRTRIFKTRIRIFKTINRILLSHTLWLTMGIQMIAAALLIQTAFAEKISNPVAEMAGLDKITGRTIRFDVYIDETVQFGALQVTPRVCYSRTPEETQRISAFVEVDELTLEKKLERIFTGWMFAENPALNAVEHPIYDIWLINCKTSSDVAPPAKEE